MLLLPRSAVSQEAPDAPSATGLQTPRPGTERVSIAEYRPISLEPVRPQIALSSATDGAVSARITVPWIWDTLDEPVRSKEYVWSYTLAPTATFTDASRSPLVSTAGAANLGLTSALAGALFAYTRQAPIIFEEEIGVLVEVAPLVVAAARGCARNACPAPEDAEFCKLTEAPGFDPARVRPDQLCPRERTLLPEAAPPQAVQSSAESCVRRCAVRRDDVPFCNRLAESGFDANAIDPADLCSEGKARLLAERRSSAAVSSALASSAKLRRQRLLFPEVDFSVWLGGGGSRFAYYEPDTGSGTPPPSYSSTSSWRPSGAAASQLVVVPWTTSGPLGLTLEVPVAARLAYVASATTGSACATAGTVAPGGSPLSSCSASLPIGAPRADALLAAKAYVGLIDRDHAYWRVALGGGYAREFAGSSEIWSLDVPFYLNATAMTLARKSDAPEQTPRHHTPVAIDYDGIVRVAPSLQYGTATSGGAVAGWSAMLNLELLGQRNLFLRADSLVR